MGTSDGGDTFDEMNIEEGGEGDGGERGGRGSTDGMSHANVRRKIEHDLDAASS